MHILRAPLNKLLKKKIQNWTRVPNVRMHLRKNNVRLESGTLRSKEGYYCCKWRKQCGFRSRNIARRKQRPSKTDCTSVEKLFACWKRVQPNRKRGFRIYYWSKRSFLDSFIEVLRSKQTTDCYCQWVSYTYCKFLPSKRLGHADGSSILIPKPCEPLD